MKPSYIRRFSEHTVRLLRRMGSAADALGCNAYIVGGMVRDAVIGRVNLDIDIVVEGDALCFAERIAAVLGGRVVRYERFGTATVILERGMTIDVATARKEYYPRPAALPVVERGTIRDDLFRRDFTINTLALQINGKHFGRLVDLYGGVKDIKGKKIRVLHDVSFIDDPTRILRALRFSKRLKFQIEPKTKRLMREALRRGMLTALKPPRLWQEFILLFKEPDPKQTIAALAQFGMQSIYPGLTFASSQQKLFDRITETARWFTASFSRAKQLEEWFLYFMVVAQELTVADIQRMVQHFGLTREQKKYLLSFKKINIARVNSFLNSKDFLPSRTHTFFEPLGREVVLLFRAMISDKKARRRIDEYLRFHSSKKISITGNDLLRLGLQPGKQFKVILDTVRAQKLDGELATKSDELAFVKKLITKKDGYRFVKG